MLYLVEVPDSIPYLESRLDEISEKTDMVDAVAGRVEGLPIQELLARVDTLEANTNVGRTVNYERGDSSSDFAAHMEERVSELDSSQKTLLEMINDMLEDFRVTLDVVRNKIADVNARLNLTIRAIVNQAPAGGAISVSKVKILEPNPFCGARDAKALENYIFDLGQYFKATNTVTEEVKVTLATMHLSEDAKLWWRSRYVDIQEGRCTIETWDALKRELRSQFFSENVEILARRKLHDLRHTGKIREYVKQFAGLMLDIRDMVQDLTSAYAAAERLFDLTSDSQDVRHHQSSSPGRNRNSRPSSPKSVGGDECPGKDRKSHQSNTENTWQRPNNRSPPKRPLSCFICGKPHLARECPNKVDFHAFQASLIVDSDDKSNQAEDEMGQIDGGERTRIGAIKYMSALQKKSGERHVPTKGGLLYVDTWINQKQTKSTMVDSGATHNFITEAEARRLKLRWERDSGKMKAVNSIALPIVGLVKRTTIKLGGWKCPVDVVVVKMDDFDVVLGMEFLLEHQVIPMASAKCLAITGSFPTVVQADIRQPNGFKMISAMQLDESRAQEEPPSVEILLGMLEKPGETVPEDTFCVPKKHHGVMPSSWPKPSSMRRRTDHRVKSPSEAKAHAKNAYRMAPPELTRLRKPSEILSNTGCSIPVQAPYGARVLSLKKKDRSPQQCVDRRTQSKLTVRRKCPFPMLTRQVDCPRGVKHLPKSDDRPRQCRVRTTKAKGLEKHYVSRHEAYKFPVVPLSLTDAKGGKCCFVQNQMSVLSHVGECHQGGSSREEDTQWSENLECQVAFNGSKQAMIEGPSLGVVDATKTPEVEAEQLSYVLEEYLHHCVDGRQKNWVQLLQVTQFSHSAQTDSLIKRSPFEIKCKRHSVLPPVADDPYVGDRPQVHRVGEECEQMANIARVCLEEASRPMEERGDQKRYPLEFEGMTKLPIDSATMPYDYLSIWTWRKIEKSKKPLLTDLQCFLYDVFNYLLSLSRFIKTFSQEREGRLRHTMSLSADSEFRTVDLLIELSKCRTIVLRSYDCDTQQTLIAPPLTPVEPQPVLN
ncbi:uncharacterized protein E5676_scaffold68G001120 [Cucumis melo var. makuwa]|uniref:Retrotransposon gag domain-containing protein n=1 Tax=Cucumis melo var. makuwa TaxID=1194695 RepID=A0A5A7TU58_CUCMM|nr:uncharacterized protein E6C27_scaffold230G001810 [Cucumis melo var. makuwa]TYK04791.1 uncharacterized protein E5676_scaffold68G001120 [Cucumis melo var. makuwa]